MFLLIGFAITAVLIILKTTGAITTGWFLWVSIPVIVGAVLQLVGCAFLGEGIEECFDFFND